MPAKESKLKQRLNQALFFHLPSFVDEAEICWYNF